LQASPLTAASRDIVFYDGGCGLCMRSVAFLLARDDAHAFDYAPLRGETFAARIDASRRASLPDSLVVLTPEGELLTRSRAVARVLRRVGGAWALVGAVIALTPRAIADRAYDAVARRRTGGACPSVEASCHARFLP
jgi:predicted DCC family thiol-disulfide oxidoreductase YuxK